MTKCRNSRDYVPEYVDNADGSRTVKMSNCMQPAVVIDAPVYTGTHPNDEPIKDKK